MCVFLSERYRVWWHLVGMISWWFPDGWRTVCGQCLVWNLSLFLNRKQYGCELGTNNVILQLNTKICFPKIPRREMNNEQDCESHLVCLVLQFFNVHIHNTETQRQFWVMIFLLLELNSPQKYVSESILASKRQCSNSNTCEYLHF